MFQYIIEILSEIPPPIRPRADFLIDSWMPVETSEERGKFHSSARAELQSAANTGFNRLLRFLRVVIYSPAVMWQNRIVGRGGQTLIKRVQKKS
jgi:hypothetical protein